jgi:hypothetical protein
MKIELIKPHTHAGRRYQPGEMIDMDADLAQWLIDIGAARAVKKFKPLTPLNLDSSVERVGVCGFPGAGQGATTRNGHSIPRSCNAAMRPENRAIRPVQPRNLG